MLLLCVAGPARAVDFPLRWRWSNPAPHGNNIIEMAYSSAQGLWVQVSERGQIFTSYDLEIWTPRESGTTNALRAVTFAGNRILVTGEGGTFLYADSPESFSPATVTSGATSNWLEGVAWSGTRAVAVGDNGVIYVSANGSSWARQASTITGWFRGITFGNNLFVAVGEGGLIATSATGQNWAVRNSTTSRDLNKITFASGRFTVVGDVGTVLGSTTGTTWTSLNAGTTNNLFTVADVNNVRLVAGDNAVRLQVGSVWSDELSKAAPAPAWTYLSSVARPDFFLIGGRTGLMAEGYRTNATTFFWVPSDDSLRRWLFDVTHRNGIYVAVGDRATVMTSANGLDWALEQVPTAVTNSIFLGIGGDTNLLVAVGNHGAIMTSLNSFTNVAVTNVVGTNMIVTNQTISTFGVIWEAIDPSPTTNDLQAICGFEGGFVAGGGNGTVLTSPDGRAWTTRSTPTTSLLSSVTSFPEGLIATGANGTILFSPDGVTWSQYDSGTTNWVYRVRYLGGQLIAVGQNGVILTSPDGATWTIRNSGTTRWLNDVTFIDGTYLVVGTQGAVLSSPDAAAWTDRGTITLKSLYGAATDGGQLVTVGIEGIILRSQVVPHLTPIEILDYSRLATSFPPMAQNVYLFGGRPDQQFTLEYKSGLTTNAWTDGAQLEFFDSSGVLYYLETFQGTNFPSLEFYRTSLTLP